MLEKFLSTRCAIEICGKIQLVLAASLLDAEIT